VTERIPLIRSVCALLRAISDGGRLMYRQAWQVSQDRGWRQWTVEYRNGDWQAVDARIALTAQRKVLVTMYHAEEQP
jgi:hypothetical protein